MKAVALFAIAGIHPSRAWLGSSIDDLPHDSKIHINASTLYPIPPSHISCPHRQVNDLPSFQLSHPPSRFLILIIYAPLPAVTSPLFQRMQVSHQLSSLSRLLHRLARLILLMSANELLVRRLTEISDHSLKPRPTSSIRPVIVGIA